MQLQEEDTEVPGIVKCLQMQALKWNNKVVARELLGLAVWLIYDSKPDVVHGGRHPPAR